MGHGTVRFVSAARNVLGWRQAPNSRGISRRHAMNATMSLSQGADALEGRNAFLEKRKPEWKNN